MRPNNKNAIHVLGKIKKNFEITGEALFADLIIIKWSDDWRYIGPNKNKNKKANGAKETWKKKKDQEERKWWTFQA